MKKVLLPILLATMVSCSKTEIKEIEKIVEVEKEVSIANNEKVINDAIENLAPGSTDKRSALVTKLKEFVNGDGSTYSGHYVYYGSQRFELSGTYDQSGIIIVSTKDFLPIEVNRYLDGQYIINYAPVKATSGEHLTKVSSFDQNKYIGYLTKSEILSLK